MTLVERALTFGPPHTEGTQVLAVGKAAAAMAAGALRVLGARITGGVVVAADLSGDLSPLETIVGDHPTPSRASESAGQRAMALAASVPEGQSLLVLLSGGASSLMAAPAEGLTLADKRQTTELLLRGGADIHAMNTVRKHISALKGGWLAARASSSLRTLALSDVVGDDRSFIGSGPTVADPTTFGEALDVLDQRGGRHSFPIDVVRRLERGLRGEVEETPKPDDPRLSRARWELVGSRFDAMAGAAAEARQRGYEVRVIEEPVVGDARTAGRAYVERLRALSAGTQPLCLISSGETTVQVRGTGRGGRNQELAASLAEHLPALESAVAFAACGSDGVDGPTDAAGAIVDATTPARASAAGLWPGAFLDANDTYHFFGPLGDLIRTGPTGTNVGDLQVCLLVPAVPSS